MGACELFSYVKSKDSVMRKHRKGTVLGESGCIPNLKGHRSLFSTEFIQSWKVSRELVTALGLRL